MSDRRAPGATGLPRTRPSVRRQLALLLALAMAPAGVLAVGDGLAAWWAEMERARADYLRDAVAAAQTERDVLLGARAALEALAATPVIREARPGPCGDAMRRVVDAQESAIFAAVTDRDGVVLCASREDAVGVNTSGSGGFDDFWARPRLVVNYFEIGPISRVPVIVASVPVEGPDGNRADGDGRKVAHLSFEASFAELDAPGARAAGSDRALIDAEGELLGRPDGGAPPAWLPAEAGWPDRLGARPLVFTAEGRDGVDRFFAAAPIVRNEAWLLAGAPEDRVLRGGFFRAAPAMLGPALMWLAGVLVAYFTIDRLVVRHVVYLSRLARAYGHGRLRLRPRGVDGAPAEVARLASDMSDMAAKLEARQQAVAAAAETNRVLLLEVYHRVKNNLQMIASLLAMESRRATTPEERATLDRVRTRVQSVALVHAMLYGGEDVSRIRLDRLTEQIMRSLLGASGRSGTEVALSLRLDPALATAEHATPFALFLTEAGANAVIHARAEGRAAAVEVELRLEPDGRIALRLSNDSAPAGGEAPGAQARGRGALGRRLMEGFAQQLGGELAIGDEAARHVVSLTTPPGRASAAAA